MNFLTGLAIFLAISLILEPSLSYAGKNKRKNSKKNRAISAKALFVLDLNKNKIMLNKNPHLKLPPASTAKVMTAILVIENLSLAKPVLIKRSATLVQPSKINLRENETYLARDLLEAVLICSANDASVALAEAVAGSEGAFVRMMNNRARQLGSLNTNFVNSTGLSIKGKGQYTTAYDLVTIMKKALLYQEIMDIMNKRESIIKSDNARTIKLKSHNKLLWEFDNAIIGKTGYTRQARHCFVGLQRIGDRKFVFAILKSRDPRTDIRRIYSILLRLTQKAKSG